MLVYMLLNTITEKVYVGATSKTLEERWRRHKESVAGGSKNPVHVAMSQWQDEFWVRVVLQNCYSEEELSMCETSWMIKTNALDQAVGYNRPSSSYSTSTQNGKLGSTRGRKTQADRKDDLQKSKVRAKKSRPAPTIEDAEFKVTSDIVDRREFFRECGMRGAVHGMKGPGHKTRANMTEAELEQCRAWGRESAKRQRARAAEESPA